MWQSGGGGVSTLSRGPSSLVASTARALRLAPADSSAASALRFLHQRPVIPQQTLNRLCRNNRHVVQSLSISPPPYPPQSNRSSCSCYKKQRLQVMSSGIEGLQEMQQKREAYIEVSGNCLYVLLWLHHQLSASISIKH